MRNLPTVTAIISAYNEADVIFHVVGELIEQGIDVFLLDDGSSDGTVERLEAFRESGRIRVERCVSEGAGGQPHYHWEAILQRKEALAAELASDWFIHADADEFREAPWPGMDLRRGIAEVDALGYNAIDFEVLNFWPTHDAFLPGEDVREAFRFFERGSLLDRVQVKCWKRTAVPVDLASTGGHEAIFPGRKIFPIRFLLRHYPLRGQRHAQRKIFAERLPRYREDERSRGWHEQYAGVLEGDPILRDPATLTRYDPAQIRLWLQLNHRDAEPRASSESAVLQLEQSTRYAARLEQELDLRNREVAGLHERLNARNADVARLQADLGARDRTVAELHATLTTRDADLARLHAAVTATHLTVAELNETLSARDVALARLHEALDNRNREAEMLQRDLDAVRGELAQIRAAREGSEPET